MNEPERDWRILHGDTGPYVAQLQWFEEYRFQNSDFASGERFASEAEAYEEMDRIKVEAMRTLGILPTDMEAARQAFALRVLGVFKRE